MAPRPRWWHQLQASKNEALLAVDLYNRSSQERQTEAFVVHMCLGWLKILQAAYSKDGREKELYEKDRRGRRKKTGDGDWLMKPLATLLQESFLDSDPVRNNVMFFVGLRNKIEHRHDQHVASLIAGKSQALVLNYERYLTSVFGPEESLSANLRFPVFVSSITNDAVESLKDVRKRVPKAVLEYVQDFDAALDPGVSAEQAYEFRVYLLPKTGPKTDADVAMTFVKLDELTPEQSVLMEQVQTVIREKQVPVAGLNDLLPGQVAEKVALQLGQEFTVNDHTMAWRHWEVRPPTGSEHPERTKSELCTYHQLFSRHIYTDSWVNFLVRKLRDDEMYEKLTGRSPVPLTRIFRDLAGGDRSAARWPLLAVMVPGGHDSGSALGRCRRVHVPVGVPGSRVGRRAGVSRVVGAGR